MDDDERAEADRLREALDTFADERAQRRPYRLTGNWTARIDLEGDGDDGERWDFTSDPSAPR